MLSFHISGPLIHLVVKVNGSYTNPRGQVYIRLLQDSIPLLEGDGQELRLTEISELEAGWYTCQVTNQFDSILSSGYLEVIQPLADPVHYTTTINNNTTTRGIEFSRLSVSSSLYAVCVYAGSLETTKHCNMFHLL